MSWDERVRPLADVPCSAFSEVSRVVVGLVGVIASVLIIRGLHSKVRTTGTVTT
jgi:hypothetical protein